MSYKLILAVIVIAFVLGCIFGNDVTNYVYNKFMHVWSAITGEKSKIVVNSIIKIEHMNSQNVRLCVFSDKVDSFCIDIPKSKNLTKKVENISEDTYAEIYVKNYSAVVMINHEVPIP